MNLQRVVLALSISAAIHVGAAGWGERLFHSEPEPWPPKRLEVRFDLTPSPPPPAPASARLARPPAPPPASSPKAARPHPPPPATREEVLPASKPRPAPLPPEPPDRVANEFPPATPRSEARPAEPTPLPNPPEMADDIHFPETRPDYSRLVSHVRDGIDQAKRYPRMARRAGYEGRTLLKFKILQSGEVRDISVLESSAFEILDNAAVAAVSRAAPFREQARKIEGEYIEIILPIVFRLR